MKQILFVTAALLAGFVGGLLGTVVTRAREDTHAEKIVRARSFELVDQTGKPISYWGIDKGGNAVLAFGSNRPALPREGGGSHPRLDDPNDQWIAIGVLDDSPFLFFRAPDGKTRMSLSLGLYEKPILWMADEVGPKVWLGAEQTDAPSPEDKNWALDFGPDRARIGLFTEEEGGQKYVRGLFYVNKEKVKDPHQQPK